MSFLKKLFGGKTDPVWRHSRVRMEPFHRISFHDSQKQEWKVGNISTTGAGLLIDKTSGPPVGQNLNGQLEIEGKRHPIETEVRHHTGKILGCRFLGEFAAIRQAIEGYLNAEILALKMNRIDPSILAPHPAGQVHWFTDGRANEVHYVMKESDLVSFHISFLGSYLEGAPDGDIRFGQIVDERNNVKPGHKSSNLIEFFNELPDEAVPLAIRIISNLQGISESERELLLRCLKYQR